MPVPGSRLVQIYEGEDVEKLTKGTRELLGKFLGVNEHSTTCSLCGRTFSEAASTERPHLSEHGADCPGVKVP